ncbi:MAG: SLBB domain-containing protein [Gammaproteobacteria bacterium]|nr:SLBB domain-containing protein [Gammaproteobacteria bacterium]MBU0848596.1 SLBB domain-containing protein [Gammaproteobacteria bacterium]MBU1267267.1 SLBB domain-containing protein [Gammaproteobacteria bacterium]MBU1530292.1 SLBB domain-containing protein [Gammaproteobacteria bacterium]MBU1780195.1 SLBB domain-containing protein [Gammaproteobacteria bacterium]
MNRVYLALGALLFAGSVFAQLPSGKPGFGSNPGFSEESNQQATGGLNNLNAESLRRLNARQGMVSNAQVNAEAQPGSPAGAETPKALPDRALSPFQRLVFENTGKLLYPFGSSALQKEFSVGAEANMPVSADYEISAGDQILVRVWGAIDVNHTAIVDRDGQLTIPTVGTFPVAGVRARNLDQFLMAEIGKYYKNFNLSATLGKLSGVNIYVAGQALAPGLHTVSSTSTLASVVFSVAQPGMNGSFRNVQLKRGGETVATFDLYDLLRKGELNGDRKLRAGDVVFVGQVGARVALNIESPAAAIFELKPGENLNDILEIAGVDRTLLRQDTVLIEGFNVANPKAPRAVEQLSYSRALNQATLQDGDIVTLFQARLEFANAVTLKGNVAAAARYPYFEGMRIADLVPNTDALIQDSYFKKKGALVQFNKADARKAVTDPKLQSQLGLDDTKLFSKADEGEKGEQKIEVLEDTITNLLSQINWDYAVIERLDRKELQTTLIPFNLRKAMAGDPSQNLLLQAGDVVTIFSANDADIPKSRTTALIKVTGEVKAPGYYQIAPGETLRDAVVKAGGLAENAFLFGAKLSRRSIVAEQEIQKQKALDQAERMLVSSQSSKSASALNAADAANAQKQAETQRAYLQRLREIKPDGRVVLDIKPDATTIAEMPPLELVDGDVVSIPAVPGQIAVFGSVYSQGAYAFEPGNTVFDYLGMAGGATKGSDKGSIFVIRANGKVDSAQQGWVPFVSGLYGKRALPGDAIYVPEDFERVSLTKTLLDYSQILFQIGLGAASVNAIKD